MSTTVKPLNIYIGDTKVFPDVDLSTLSDPFYSNDAIAAIKEASYEFMASDRSDVSQYMSGKTFICQNFDDSNSSSRHTNDNYAYNYWYFGDQLGRPTILGIDFDINAKWLWNSIGTVDQGAFKGLTNIKTLNFKGTIYPMTPAQAFDQNDHSIVLFSYLPLNNLFEGCSQLEEINGLNLYHSQQSFVTSIDPSDYGTLVYNPVTNDAQWISTYENNTLLGNCSRTFADCEKLTTLDIRWPSTLYTCNASGMFLHCSSLPDNQIPTFNFVPIYIPYTVPDGDRNYVGSPTIDITFMFAGCSNVTSTHLSTETWQYIKDANRAWEDTQVHSIDIPATATNLINVAQIIGRPLGVDDGQGGTDYSNCKYIIRTTAPMTAKLNSVENNDCLLFNFWDYDGATDFINTFGGLYVPDEQLTDWQNAIANEWGASNIAQNCVHGLSAL